MKNQYSKFIKYLEKQDNIFVQRSGDSVYLTDGNVALMVPSMVYDSMIRPLSGLLPELKEDCTGAKRVNDLFVEVRQNGMDIKNVVEKLNTEKIITKTNFLLEIPSTYKRGKLTLVRIFKTEGKGDIIAINNTFVEIFSECSIGEPWRSSGCWNGGIIQKNNDFAFVIMPMKIDSKYFEIWKD